VTHVATGLVSLLAWGWVWENRKRLISGNFLALGVALGAIDSKGVLGFGKRRADPNLLIVKHLLKSLGLESEIPNFVIFRQF
jgi:hypothetical protein